MHLLCALLDLCYETTGQPTDLLNALQVLEDAIAATPTTDARRAGMLHNLGVCHAATHTLTGAAADIAKAVAATPQCAPVSQRTWPRRTTATAPSGRAGPTPPADPRRALLLNNIGGFLSARFAQAGELQDLHEAIEAAEAAVAATPEDHEHRPTMLVNLSTYLSNRFDRTRDGADLDAVIEARKEALAVTPLDDPGRAGGLQRLAYRLHCRFERTAAAEDLDNRRSNWLRSRPAGAPSLWSPRQRSTAMR